MFWLIIRSQQCRAYPFLFLTLVVLLLNVSTLVQTTKPSCVQYNFVVFKHVPVETVQEQEWKLTMEFASGAKIAEVAQYFVFDQATKSHIRRNLSFVL